MNMHSAAARENARQTDGKFGTQVHDEVALDLSDEGFSTTWPAAYEGDGVRATVRTKNGGEVSGFLSTQGSTYPVDVRTDSGRVVSISGERVQSLRIDDDPRVETTLKRYAGARRGNYCRLPTVDVPILSETRHCADPGCGDEVAWEPKAGSFGSGLWVHRHHDRDHSARPRPACRYCHSDDPAEVTFAHQSYSDETSCTRCGGVDGYPIGD